MIKYVSFFFIHQEKNGENCGACKMQLMSNEFNSIQNE
jgi:hypothetical protein